MTPGRRPVLTPQGHLVLAPTADAATLPSDLPGRLESAFARGAGHGLLELGLREVSTAMPAEFAYWRDFARPRTDCPRMPPRSRARSRRRIAGISLLVGGIGIMNIMLVSVTERTREIGIRMAVGAQPAAIRFQFLIEAIILSVLGGLAGVLLGIGIAKLLELVLNFKAIISLGSILLAFGVSFSIGVFFGFYPARKAAALDPIEALRYE